VTGVNPYTEIGYTDELLADRSVHRRFTDGREEWRQKAGATVVQWRDNQGHHGTDELLGDGIIKRQYGTEHTIYGREQGYGRTLWSNGLLTVNRTTFGGRMGVVLTAIGAGALLGALVAPPLLLTSEEELMLRQQQQQAQQSSSSDSGGGSSGGGDSGGGGDGDDSGGSSDDDWDDDGTGIDDDFG